MYLCFLWPRLRPQPAELTSEVNLLCSVPGCGQSCSAESELARHEQVAHPDWTDSPTGSPVTPRGPATPRRPGGSGESPLPRTPSPRKRIAADLTAVRDPPQSPEVTSSRPSCSRLQSGVEPLDSMECSTAGSVEAAIKIEQGEGPLEQLAVVEKLASPVHCIESSNGVESVKIEQQDEKDFIPSVESFHCGESSEGAARDSSTPIFMDKSKVL